MIRESAFALMLGLSLTAAAQESPTPASADFTAGFQRLVALGLPPLEGAEWIAAGDESHESDYSLREIFQELKGNGWKIQQDGKPMFLPLGQLTPQEMPAKGGDGGGGGSLLGALFGGGAKKDKAGDPVKDAAKLIAILGDPEKSKEFRSRLEYSDNSALGCLLLYATQLHQTGHPKEANQLVATIFTLGVNPESVIDAAIERLAARDLSRVTEAFFTSHDWAAYERDLRALTERYPRGWEDFPAVQMLLPAVTRRVAGEMPAKPAIPGITLHPEALAALEATLRDNKKPADEDAVARYAKENDIPASELTPQVRQQIARMLASGDDESSNGPWLIVDSTDEDTKDPWSQLKRLGLDALPALAAIAGDETLTFSRNDSSNRSSYRSSTESAAERALKAYQSMDRPQTRGELACRLLTTALPGETDDESTPQMIAEAAMEFWKAHRGKSKLDLLLVFLAEGDSSQKSTAATALAEMPDAAARQAFEKQVLESDDVADSLDSVSTYLKLHKSAAKDFFARFSTALKSQLEGADLDRTSGGYMIKQAGGVDKYLKKLSLFVGGESPRQLVFELAKTEKPDTQQIYSLAATVAESSPETFVQLYLEAAVAATHPETRAVFLTALSSQSNKEPDDEGNLKESPVPASQIPHWATLLGDERLIPNGVQIRTFAAGALEQLYGSTSREKAYELSLIGPTTYQDLILARANARVAGKSPAPLPDADQVSSARLEEMLKTLGSTKPENVHEFIQSRQPDEKLAFHKWQADPENQAKIPASLLAARKLLTKPVDTAGKPPVAPMEQILTQLDLKPGTKVDAERITTLVGTLSRDAKARSTLYLSFANSNLNSGITVGANQGLDPDKIDANRMAYTAVSLAGSALTKSTAEAVIFVYWHASRKSYQAVWTITGNNATPPEPDMVEKLNAALNGLGQTDSAPLYLTISVLHRDDLEKLNQLRNNDNGADPFSDN